MMLNLPSVQIFEDVLGIGSEYTKKAIKYMEDLLYHLRLKLCMDKYPKVSIIKKNLKCI